MKNKISSFFKSVTGRGFYLTAAVCLCLIAAAVGVIYRSATNLMKEYITPQVTETQQVEAEKDNEPDPRLTTEEPETSTTKGTTEITTEKETAESEPATSEEPVISFGNSSYIYPVTGEILKDYSDTPVYDETMDDWRVHKGIDIICPMGSNVSAVGNGKVTKVYHDTGYGYCIEIDHGDFTGRYCGLEQGTTIKIDDEVKQGDLVGLTGETACEKAQQEHFHFEILKDGLHSDPVEELR